MSHVVPLLKIEDLQVDFATHKGTVSAFGISDTAAAGNFYHFSSYTAAALEPDAGKGIGLGPRKQKECFCGPKSECADAQARPFA